MILGGLRDHFWVSKTLSSQDNDSNVKQEGSGFVGGAVAHLEGQDFGAYGGDHLRWWLHSRGGSPLGIYP